MFGHIFINRLKILLKTKSAIFWTLAFPIILATLFNMAFANVGSSEKFKNIKLAVVNNEMFENDVNFKNVINSLSVEGDNKLFDTKYVDEITAQKLLEENEVDGYIIVRDNIDIVIKNNGIEQSTIKQVVDNYYQFISVITNVSIYNPETIAEHILVQLSESEGNFNNISKNKVDYVIIPFYTLIGMVCLYGGMFGINAVIETEANLSKKGARVSVSPAHKFKLLLVSLLVGLIIQYAEVLIVLAYALFILGIDFGNQLMPILLITFLGSMAGLSLGMFVGSSNNKSENNKLNILISIVMLFCFLSGMMNPQVKYYVDTKIPVLSKINPVNMITDGLYSLYYYDNLDRFFSNIVNLTIFLIILIIVSYFFVRRKSYDSI